MLNRKPLMVAALAATVAVATLSTQAYANDDALLGAVIGAGIGAAIGHSVHGRDGAVVGGAIGALAGASIAAGSDRYYDVDYDSPVYYGPAETYYQTAPVYYGRPPFIYATPRADYIGYHSPRYVQQAGTSTMDATTGMATTATADADDDSMSLVARQAAPLKRAGPLFIWEMQTSQVSMPRDGTIVRNLTRPHSLSIN